MTAEADNPAGLTGGEATGLGVGEVLKVAAPAALSMVNVTIMQFVDRWMVARLIGPRAFAATFVAGVTSFIFIAMMGGVNSVVNTFVAQNLGAGRRRRCGQYAWQGLYLSAVWALLLLPVAASSDVAFERIARLIVVTGGEPTSAQEVALQAVYFRILVSGAGLRLCAGVLERYFYGTHRPRIVYVVSVMAVGVNVGLNYSLITGWWVFPKLGLAGAALGTVLAWAAELAVLAVVFFRRREDARFASRRGWRLQPRLCWDLLRVGVPTAIHWGNDLWVWSIFNVLLVGWFGEVHRVASAAAVQFMHLSFMPTIGVSIACTAVVGRHIGAGRPDVARKRAHAGILIAVTYMGLCGLAYLLFRHQLVRVFISAQQQAKLSPEQLQESLRIGAWVLIVAAGFQCFDALGIAYSGALRGAGDTLWPMAATLALSWGVMVPAGIAMVRLAPQLTSIGPWIAASGYVIILGLVLARRFESGAWRKIDLLGRVPAAAPVPAEPVSALGAVPQPGPRDGDEPGPA